MKSLFKKIGVLRGFNASYKRLKTSFDSWKIGRDYQRLIDQKGVKCSEEQVVGELKKRLSQRRLNFLTTNDRRARVFWLGANYNQDNGGFLQGLSRFGDVVSFKNAKGEYGFEYSSRLFDPELIKRNGELLLKQVDQALASGPVDMLWTQAWAHLISAEVFQEVQKKGIVTFNVAWDDRLPQHWKVYNGSRMGAIGLAPGFDLTLESSPECCLRYVAEGHLSLYWPMASDPDLFRPYPGEKLYDVCFVGSNYGVRAKIVKAIEDTGIKVAAFGPGWPLGSIDTKKMAEVFARSKVVLGVGTIGYNEDILTLKLRDFDAPMSGSFYITHNNSDLKELYKIGCEIECYNSAKECADKIRYYVAHPGGREEIAKAGRKRALECHTWEKRFEKIFDML